MFACNIVMFACAINIFACAIAIQTTTIKYAHTQTETQTDVHKYTRTHTQRRTKYIRTQYIRTCTQCDEIITAKCRNDPPDHQAATAALICGPREAMPSRCGQGCVRPPNFYGGRRRDDPHKYVHAHMHTHTMYGNYDIPNRT